MMSLSEFDQYMKRGGYKYSILALLHLEDAAGYAAKAKRAEGYGNLQAAVRWRGAAADAQLDALHSAEYEKQRGRAAGGDHPLDRLATPDAEYMRDVEAKWTRWILKVRKMQPKLQPMTK